MNNEADLQIQSIFNNVNDWLKFAEAKNGAIAAVNVALIVGIIPFLSGEQKADWLQFYLIMMVVFSGISFLVALASFLPTTQTPHLDRLPQPNETSNLLFFGYIANHSVDSYVEVLKVTLGENTEPSKLGRAYIEQAIANSRIAIKKYDYFAASLFFLATALVTLPGLLVFLLMVFIAKKFRLL